MWNVAPVMFEDEDEEQLKADFITYSARYPDVEPFEIGAYVFRHQRDPEMRSQQAVMIWLKDLDVKERIRLAKLNGGVEDKGVETKEDKLRKLEAIYNDADVSVSQRLKAMELHAQIQGEIVKAVEKKTEDRTKRFPQIVFARYDD